MRILLTFAIYATKFSQVLVKIVSICFFLLLPEIQTETELRMQILSNVLLIYSSCCWELMKLVGSQSRSSVLLFMMMVMGLVLGDGAHKVTITLNCCHIHFLFFAGTNSQWAVTNKRV